MAMKETELGVDEDVSDRIGKKLEKKVTDEFDLITVDELQDLVEDYLMNSDRKDVAKRYIIYRNEKDKTRETIRVRTWKSFMYFLP